MKRGLLLLLFLSISLWLYAQEPIRFGDREVYLEANVHSKVRGRKTSSLELGVPTGDRLNVLVQFASGEIAYEALKQKGVELGDYLGSNAYYAQIAPGSRPTDFAGTGLRTVVPIRAEWKLTSGLLNGQTPEWAAEGDRLKVTLSWFKSVSAERVKEELHKQGVELGAASEILRNIDIVATREQVLALAELEYVSLLRWIAPPMELHNREAARLSAATFLRLPIALSGRGLTGKNVRVGIWDANVGDHVDYGNRVHRQEFEMPGSTHGMHTTGTVIGSGLVDERGRGMAPEAEIWTNNFNIQSNGKKVVQEMYETYMKERITLTSNSYGYSRAAFCDFDEYLNYSFLGNTEIDELAYMYPALTHVFSAGNAQGECMQPFSHATNYGKNIISVAALDAFGGMSDFSSFGPLEDGRMFPVISARGAKVYSTVLEQGYALKNGTSMACPTVTGHLALLTQRYMQLHGGATPYNYFLKALIANTARDAGNPGPDYKFGFGILDAEAAVTAIENSWHKLSELKRGDPEQVTTIKVPTGVKELRVMLCWNDPVAAKDYVKGECPLINDLDLSATMGSQAYLPFTLDPSKPDANAVSTKPNKVDNIEQIVIANPAAGDFVVKVSGIVKQGDKQQYALVWYYDYKTPELFSPLPGDVYSPKETIYLRAENVSEQVRVDLSQDGGKSFVSLGMFDKCSAVSLPGDIAPTDKAVLRLTDANGISISTKGYFTIMPQVYDLALEATSCSTSDWKLKWPTVKGATKYEVLRADINNATYNKIGESATTEFLIPAEYVTKERNIYSVQAVADNIRSRRSVAVVADKIMPMPLTETDLPYTETFVGWPLQNTEIEKGENLKLTMQDAIVELQLPFMSHHVVWQVKKEATKWQNPFQQKENVGALKVCSLDLTKVAKGTHLQFSTVMLMKKTKENPKNGSLLRLLVNGQEVEDMLGRKHIAGDDHEHNIVWDLTEFAGQKISLALEAALEKKDNIAIIAYYQISQQPKQPDVEIAWVNRPAIKAKAQMKEETITCKLVNRSALELADVPVSVQVDGKVVYTKNIQKLKPFEEQIIAYPYNFSSNSPHFFQVDVRADLPNDATPENNAERFEVYNLGDVIAMPEVSYIKILGVPFPIPPRITKTLTGTIAFTDGCGALAPYQRNEKAFLKVLPSDPSHAVQVTFSEIKLAVHDTLYVFTGDVDKELKVNAKMATGFLTGEIPSASFISEAQDGAITFMMMGHNEEPSDGWLGEFNELAMPDLWKMKSLKEIAGSDPNHVKLEVQVENLTNVSYSHVGLWLTTNSGVRRVEIPELKPKAETTFVVPDEIDKTAPMYMEVTAELARDGDQSNNSSNIIIANDPIWNGGGTIKIPKRLYISEVFVAGSNEKVKFEPNAHITYKPEKKFALYKSKNSLKLVLSKEPTAAQTTAKLRVWVDLDGNNELSTTAPELVTVPLQEDVKTYWVELDYTTLASLTAGERRFRFMLADDENYNKFRSGQTMEWGSVADVTADIKTEPSPHDYEVALLSIEGVKSRRALSHATELKVELKNNGLAPLTQVKLSYQINDGMLVKETFSTAIAPRTKGTVTFNTKADLSAIGKYKITVKLEEEDINVRDNEVAKIVYNIAPKNNDKLFALNFVGSQDEGLLFPRIDDEIDDKATVEGWWKLDGTQLAEYISGEGIFLVAVAGYAKIPDNSLALIVGGHCQFTSTKPVVKPGQWQHIAVAMSKKKEKPTDLNHITTIEVYVDGEKVEMKREGRAGFYFNDFALNNPLKGQNAMFRIWKEIRSEDDIKANMSKSVRNTALELPDGCVGEYIYTEGEGRASQYGDDNDPFTAIIAERNDIWKPIQNVIANIEVEGQLIPVAYNASEAIVTMPQDFTDFANVKVKFTTDWPGAKVQFAGSDITEGQVFDFSNAEHKLVFKGTRPDLFGLNLQQELTVKLVNDLSNACDIAKLSLLKTKNTGLKDDLVITKPEETINLEAQDESATNTIDITKVTIVIDAISPNAKIYKGDEELTVGSDIKLDLSTPQILRVVAQNQRDVKHYILRMAIPQELTWSNEKITRSFTSEGLLLDAKASSGLKVKYVSENPSVVTIDAHGNLYTTAVGTTKIFAVQEGNMRYKAADKREREVEVTRVPLTIKMLPATMPQGDKLPNFEFEYEGLQFEGTEYQFDTEYVVKMPDGNIWNPTMPPLEEGEYTVVAKGYNAPYESGNYMVTRTEGKLTVTDATKARRVTITVKDEQGAALKDVTVRCGEVTLITPEDGVVQFLLQPGKYTLLAQRDGYTSAQEAFMLKGRSLQFDLKLNKLVYTLTYKADDNGIVQGSKTQKVAAGGEGKQVVAVPKSVKYKFKQWSDGNTLAARTDKDVAGNIDVTAAFEPIRYKLTYVIGQGGVKVSGDLEQMVAPEEDGTPVEVKAEEGYVFMGWSDGQMSPSRTDKKITKDLTLEARFFKAYQLTWSEDFESGEACLNTWSCPKPDDGDGWLYSKRKEIRGNTGSEIGYALLIDADHDYAWNEETSAISPWLTLAGRAAGSKVVVSFARNYVQEESNDVAKAQYCFEDGEWKDGIEITPNDDGEEMTFEIDDATLASHKFLRLRWYLTNPESLETLVAIDDIKVKYSPDPTDVVLRYMASEHGKLQKEGSAELATTLEFTTAVGTPGTKVTAIPDAGYIFDKWSDGKTTEVSRQDDAEVSVYASFKLAPKTMYSVSYAAKANGSLQGLLYQRVAVGEKSTPVVAVANDGYQFAKWSDGSTQNPRIDVVNEDGKLYEAEFTVTPPVYTLTYVAGEHGEVLGNLIQSVAEGGSGTEVEAVADDAYRFKKWDDGITTAKRTDVNIMANKQVIAEFEALPTYTLTYIAGAGGTIRGKATQTVAEGASGKEVEAVPNAGYHFVKWDDGKTTAKRTDANVTESKTYTAEFAVDVQQYTLTYIAGVGGSIVGNATQTVEAGGSGTPVTAKANDGYRFVKWDDGKTDNPRTDANVTENKTYTAEFEQIPPTTYTLTYVAGDHGTIEGDATQTINAGGSGTEVEAKADAGYHFVKWDDGKTTAKRTDANVTESKTYTAEFAVDVQQYTLTYIAGVGGSIVGNATQTVNAGGSGTEVEAVPNTGYHFVKWSDGKTTAKRTDANVTESKTYTAEFAADTPKTFVVTLAPVEGQGELKIVGIAEDKLNAVPAGTELMAVATPKAGWKLKSLMAGDKDISADGKFTVTSDVAVKAVFEEEDNPNPPSPDPNAVNDAILANVQVIPNPFTTALRLICNGATGCYELLNAHGVLVRSGNLANGEVTIETTDLTSGLYLLRLTSANGATKVVRLVKD